MADRLNPTEAAAGLFLGLIGFAVAKNAQGGTLGTWFASKFLNRGEPPPATTGGPTTSTTSPPTSSTGGLAPGANPGSPASEPNATFGDPVPGGVTISVWGDPRDGGTRLHQGIDIKAPRGTPVRAVAAGTIKYSTADSGRCGVEVSVAHSAGWRSVYCHLDQAAVRVGDTVTRGQIIGTVGNTGNARTTTPHLHFELRRNDIPVDPQRLIGR